MLFSVWIDREKLRIAVLVSIRSSRHGCAIPQDDGEISVLFRGSSYLSLRGGAVAPTWQSPSSSTSLRRSETTVAISLDPHVETMFLLRMTGVFFVILSDRMARENPIGLILEPSGRSQKLRNFFFDFCTRLWGMRICSCLFF